MGDAAENADWLGVIKPTSVEQSEKGCPLSKLSADCRLVLLKQAPCTGDSKSIQVSSFLSHLQISKCGNTEKDLGQGGESRWEAQRMETLEARKVENMEHIVGVNTQKNFLSPGFYKMFAGL